MKLFLKLFMTLFIVLVFSTTVIAGKILTVKVSELDTIPADYLKIATGTKDGNYYRVAGALIAQRLKDTTNVALVLTKGSGENIRLLKSNKVDAAISQFDALLTLGKDLNVEVVQELYREYAQLIVLDDSGIDSIKDFLSKDRVLAVGPDLSGTSLTWDGLKSLDDNYGKIATSPKYGNRALGALESGDVDGVLFVTGLKPAFFMQSINTQPKKFNLAEVDDWNFNNLKWKGKQVYKFHDIDDDVYAFEDSDIETVTVAAVLLANSEWADENPDTYDDLYRASSKSAASIQAKLEKQ